MSCWWFSQPMSQIWNKQILLLSMFWCWLLLQTKTAGNQMFHKFDSRIQEQKNHCCQYSVFNLNVNFCCWGVSSYCCQFWQIEHLLKLILGLNWKVKKEHHCYLYYTTVNYIRLSSGCWVQTSSVVIFAAHNQIRILLKKKKECSRLLV